MWNIKKNSRRYFKCCCSLLYVICLQQTSSAKIPIEGEEIEFCDWERLDLGCDDNSVLLISRAVYGRITVGRCLTKKYGEINCFIDVLDDIQMNCAGRQNCSLRVIDFHERTPCTKDLTAHLILNYRCIAALVPDLTSCSTTTLSTVAMTTTARVNQIDNDLETGIISGVIYERQGFVDQECPLVIVVKSFQRINLTLIDFSKPLLDDRWLPLTSPSSVCTEYGKVVEKKNEISICGHVRRENHVYTSETNQVEIWLNLTAIKHLNFLLSFQAIGCKPLSPPPGGWITRTESESLIKCNNTKTQWTRTCVGTQWTGENRNCTAPTIFNDDHHIKPVETTAYDIILILVIGGCIGIVTGVLLLLGTMLYIRRFQKRKVRSRSHYTLHPIYEEADKQRELLGTANRYPIYSQCAPFNYCTCAWQQMRPLPIPEHETNTTNEAAGTATSASPICNTNITCSSGYWSGLDAGCDDHCIPSSGTFRRNGTVGSSKNGHLCFQPESPYYFKLDPSALNSSTMSSVDQSYECSLCQAEQ